MDPSWEMEGLDGIGDPEKNGTKIRYKVHRVVTPFMEVMKKPPWIPENHDRSRVKQLLFIGPL